MHGGALKRRNPYGISIAPSPLRLQRGDPMPRRRYDRRTEQQEHWKPTQPHIFAPLLFQAIRANQLESVEFTLAI